MSDNHILLIISQPKTAKDLQDRALDPAGYRVTSVAEWKSAQAVIKEDPPDLVILSQMLEGEEYDKFARVLFNEHPLLPVILLAQDISDQLLIDSLRGGFAEYLQPPYHAPDVLRAVDKVLGRKQSVEEYLSQLFVKETIDVKNSADQASTSAIESNKLKTILAKIEEGVIVIDHDGRLVLINQKASEAFSIEGDSLTGKRVAELIQNPEILEILEEDDQDNPSRMEITLGDGRVLNAQLSPIPEIGLVITMQDITHLKELDRIKTDFVNTVSHDLRSPLTAILGYVELLERVGQVNDQQKEFIQRIQLSVHNITSLINDLLDLGRIEAGFDVRNEIVQTQAIIQYAVDGLQSNAQEKFQELTMDVPEELPPVLGNPARLRQMLGNMISNAITYTPEKGQIKVHARAEGAQVILQVIDNGPGIPAPDQPYIFDKFYRAGNISFDIPGTGLGLAIVKSIVESHLGRIWVDSTLGEGSTFTVVLPTTDREL